MEIRKAVITAAGKSQRQLPLQSLVDRDGQTKSALAIIIEEVLSAGIESIAVVISPGDSAAFRAAVFTPDKIEGKAKGSSTNRNRARRPSPNTSADSIVALGICVKPA